MHFFLLLTGVIETHPFVVGCIEWEGVTLIEIVSICVGQRNDLMWSLNAEPHSESVNGQSNYAPTLLLISMLPKTLLLLIDF